MNIRDFIIEKRTQHSQRYRNQTAAEVLLEAVPPEIPNWAEVFRDGGYYMVNPNLGGWVDKWQEMHQWCVANFGENHYAWNGNNFWFENEKDAIMFALKWS